MHYTLMHKEIPVVDIELDDASGAITRVDDVHNARTFQPALRTRTTFSTARHSTNGGMGVPFRQAVKASNKRSLFCVSAARKSLSIKATDLAFRISIGSRRKVPRWNGLRSIFSQMIFPVTSVTFFLAVTAPVRKSI